MEKGEGGGGMKPVYTVIMYRWGDRELHSYLLGVFTTKTKAMKAGEFEQAFRGGNKYYPEILEVPLDTTTRIDTNFKVVMELKQNPYFIQKVRKVK
jgi:hypothetical protein